MKLHSAPSSSVVTVQSSERTDKGAEGVKKHWVDPNYHRNKQKLAMTLDNAKTAHILYYRSMGSKSKKEKTGRVLDREMPFTTKEKISNA